MVQPVAQGGLLALNINNVDDSRHIVALGEGCTPLLDYVDRQWA